MNMAASMPAWNLANASTPDATLDGSVGILLEDDLVPGKPGKDGATVTKTRIGPFTLRSGQTLTQPLMTFPAPCSDCYITAMQLTCEYEDGKEANVDTGAWW
jgi:hypothetical protein